MRNPESFFDCLSITAKLQSSLQGVSRLDMQRVGFLSCILALYDKQPVSEWGYQFANTDFGKPFSYQLNEATTFLHETGRLTEQNGRFSLSEDGLGLTRQLENLNACRIRARYTDAACFSTLAVPQSTLTQGLDHEPTVASSQLRTTGAMLLDGPAVELLYEQFVGLSSVFRPDSADLISPSVLWLSYSADSPISRAVS